MLRQLMILFNAYFFCWYFSTAILFLKCAAENELVDTSRVEETVWLGPLERGLLGPGELTGSLSPLEWGL